jgi:hypothetical protein
MCDGLGRITWRFDRQGHSVASGKVLRLETRAPAVIRWSSDGWKTCHDIETCDIGLGLHVADVPTRGLSVGSRVQFTFRWPEAGRWEGRDFAVEIGAPDAPVVWRFDRPQPSMPCGKVLRLEAEAPAVVRWSSDGWGSCHDMVMRRTGRGLHVAELPTEDLPAGGRVQFTFRWPEVGRWEGRDFAVEIIDPKTSFGGKGKTNSRSD